MSTPKRKCKDCGKIGKWTVYLIWDATREIKIGRRKHWLCPECDKEGELYTRSKLLLSTVYL